MLDTTTHSIPNARKVGVTFFFFFVSDFEENSKLYSRTIDIQEYSFSGAQRSVHGSNQFIFHT